MIKFLYKLVGIFFSAFIVFLIFINFNLFSFKDSFIIRLYYSVKVNLIYFIYYFLYLAVYFRYIYHK